jgi:hypothetical protein
MASNGNTFNHIIFSLLTATFFMCCSWAHAGGHDFINEARAIYRVVACSGGALPGGIDAAVIEDHCSRMGKNIENYRFNFIQKAAPFMAASRPGGIPRTIVVPFGGGDLLPAIVVYPEASEITTISLEGAGDPRRLLKANRQQLRQALEEYRLNVGFMLMTNDSSNSSIRSLERGLIPNQLAFSLTALSILGREPVSLKFFRVENDGSIHYLTFEEIAELEKVRGQRLKGSWIDSDFSVAYRNMELVFRKKAGGDSIIHRHIAFNLDDKHLAGSGVLRHLEKKGNVSVMIKGASYLLWFDNFSALRNYLLGHMAFCISDSTGLLPKHASNAGFKQTTYGKFTGAFLEDEGGSNASAMRSLFESQPFRPLPFRFGYSDIHGANHLIITRPR